MGVLLALVVVVVSGCAAPTTQPPAVNSPIPPTAIAAAATQATLASPTTTATGAAVATPTLGGKEATLASPTAAGGGEASTTLKPPAQNTAAPSSTRVEHATATAVVPPPTPDTQHPLLRPDMSIRKVATVGGANVKLARNPMDGELYYLHPNDGVFHVDVKTGDTKRVIASTDIISNGVAAGMAFAPNGTLLVLYNQNVGDTGKLTRAILQKGTPSNGSYTWTSLMMTEPYALAGNNFDHFYNGLVVSPDGKWVFINAGSRSDHGEIEDNQMAFPDLREVPLTSAILRVPFDAQNLVLPADESALKPYVYADGTRNAYDPEFAPNGDLIVGDNGPDADYPDELDWIREGHHYGFPWKFGVEDNPQQFPTYTGIGDRRLQSGFFSVDNGFYRTDKTFPTPPPGVTFTEPIVNLGPDADIYRADDGSEHDAAKEGKTLSTFTPHRSPLGLVFVTGDKLPADLRSTDKTISAFITSWGAAAGTLSDRGADLLHLQLTKTGDNYEMMTTKVAAGFNYPIDGVLIDNHYYLLEWGENGAIWEITFANKSAHD